MEYRASGKYGHPEEQSNSDNDSPTVHAAILPIISVNTLCMGEVPPFPVIDRPASLLGLFISFKFDLPTASTITVSLGLLFIVSLFIGAKTGRFARHTNLPPETAVDSTSQNDTITKEPIMETMF
jgi:hypothetical protein